MVEAFHHLLCSIILSHDILFLSPGVTEGYTTPPASLTPHTSPCKNTSVNLNSSPLKLSSGDSDCLPLPSRRMSGPHGQIFSSSRDILRSVYTGLQDSVNLNALPTFDSSPKKRSRTYSLIEQDEEEGEGKDRIEIDLPATSLPPRNLNRKIKPLPFRLSTTHRLSLPSSVGVAASSVYATPGSVKPDLGAADDEDPFSPSLPVSRNPTDMETDVDMLRDGVEVL